MAHVHFTPDQPHLPYLPNEGHTALVVSLVGLLDLLEALTPQVDALSPTGQLWAAERPQVLMEAADGG